MPSAISLVVLLNLNCLAPHTKSRDASVITPLVQARLIRFNVVYPGTAPGQGGSTQFVSQILHQPQIYFSVFPSLIGRSQNPITPEATGMVPDSLRVPAHFYRCGF